MRELYTIQPEESKSIISNGSFKIKHPTLNKYWSLEGDALKVNAGTPTVFTLEKKDDIFEKTNPWGALKTADGRYIRHSGYVMWANPWTPDNFDFAWIFYKQSDGSFQIFNPFPGPSTPGTFVGYDASQDRVLIVNPGDSKIVNWQVEFTNPPAPPPPQELGKDTAVAQKPGAGAIVGFVFVGLFVVAIIAAIIYALMKSKPKGK